MEITLRKKQYKAEHLTDLNYLPIGSLYIDSDGRFALSEIDDYESLSQQQKNKLTLPLMQRLADPDNKASIAQALSAIFPSLPKDLVSYSGKGDFRLNLQLQELLEVAIALGNALTPKSGNEQKRIFELEAEIQRLKGAVLS